MNNFLLLPNEKKPIELDNSQMDLETVQEMLGGYVEVLALENCMSTIRVMLVNEEGLLQKLDINRQASILRNGPIVGPAIVTSHPEWC